MKTKTTPGTKPLTRSVSAKAVSAVGAKAPKILDALPVDGEPSAGVGARLRYVRELHGLSQRELARRAGLNHGTIGCIEKETISPSVGSVRKILAKPEIKARFEAASAELEPSTPDEFRVFIARQLDNWGRRVREAGIQPE